MKFTLADDNRKSDGRDETGVVMIKLILVEKGATNKVGNITKTIRLKDARVSDVYSAIMSELVDD